jgi:hypothetical protein
MGWKCLKCGYETEKQLSKGPKCGYEIWRETIGKVERVKIDKVTRRF